MSILREPELIFVVENEIDEKLLKHIVSDPVFSKREKKIVKHYLTKINRKLSQQQVIDKVAMYFGYEKKVVYQAISTLYEHWEGITERAVEKTTVEYETIENSPLRQERTTKELINL